MSLEAIEKLVEEFRKLADEVDDKSGVTMSADAARHFRWCAEKLEAALRAEGQGELTEERAQNLARSYLYGAMGYLGISELKDEAVKDVASRLRADFAAAAPSPHKEGCQTCHGERVIESKPAGAGHSDDLAEYVPCPDCAALHKEGAQPTMKQLLDFLDDEAAKWAEEVHLPEIVAAITGNAEKVDAMLRQSFIEGGYRGACAASPAGRAEQATKEEK